MTQTLIMISLWCGFGYKAGYLNPSQDWNNHGKCRERMLKCVDSIKKSPNKTFDEQILECAKKEME